jgi:hypothetical protein
MNHFEDKVRVCKFCGKKEIIKFNEIGKVWHLGGFTNDNGETYYGTACLACFDKIKKGTMELK